MPAQDETTGASGHLHGAAENLAQHLEGKAVTGPAHEVQSEQRLCPHGVDVAERVGYGNGSPRRRVVNDRREEVHRGYQRAVRRQRKDGGVIPGSGIDQDSGVYNAGQVAQDLRQVGRAELAGSTGTVRERGEPDPGFLVDGRVGHTASSVRQSKLPAPPRSTTAARSI